MSTGKKKSIGKKLRGGGKTVSDLALTQGGNCF